jgi:Rrf2 family transcriptional regulator, cysteine metabolism repressor
MIFTTKAEYGVRLLVELGRQNQTPPAPVSLKAIAEAEGLPLAYLERIVALLKKAGLVESTRGAHGGYRLARPAAEITMDEAVLALEGVVAPMACFVDTGEDPPSALRASPHHRGVLCSHEADNGHGCATKLLWTRVQGGMVEAMKRTTLAELIEFSSRAAVGGNPNPLVTING